MNDQHDGRRSAMRLAALTWCAAAILYVGLERAAAYAFTPPYSYARNYISDLGVPVCGTIFDGRGICSPLHGLMNTNFVLQGLLFFFAGLVSASLISSASRFVFVGCATLNGIGNCLVGLVPEDTAGQLAGSADYHVLGAVLAIVFGNAAALVSVWTFRELGLARMYQVASLALPLVAGLALAMLIMARGSQTPGEVPDGVWERISVYTITSWELLSAACFLWSVRHRQG